MQHNLDIVDKLAVELQSLLPMKPEYQQKLDKKIRLEFNYNSNHIEGNTLTYGETELLLIFDKTTGNHELREYEEMKSHDVAFEMIKEWAADKERPLTEADIKELHRILLIRPFWKEAITPDGQPTRRQIEVGAYKKYPNSVRLQNGEIFHYASPEETPMQMGELLQWYRSEEDAIHPVTLATMLHYKFVRIHPFDDGNGRLSRLLMNYVLFKYNLPPVIIKTGDKKNYLFALNQADTGDYAPFIAYITEKLVWSLELYIKASKGESLEEQADLEKEIAIWKRQAVSQKVNALHRNDDLVYELYMEGIKELLRDFIDQHKHFFDVFQKTAVTSFKNDSGQAGGMDWLDNTIRKIKTDLRVPRFKIFAEDPEPTEPDEYTSLHVSISLKEYKYNEINPFSITSTLRVVLDPYKYQIKYNNKILAEKNYDEYLTSEERKQLVADCVKDVFAQIKSNSAKK